MKKLMLAAALVAFATPSFADFYIVQDATTKKCTIVDKKPTTTTTTVVGNGKPRKRQPSAVMSRSKKTLLPESVTSNSEILKVKPER